MPWKNQGGGPWGSGPKGPWGSGPQPVGPRPPDLEDLLRRGQDRLQQLLPGGYFSGLGIALILIAAVAIWGLSGFFRVQSEELGVVLRFGKHVRTVQPGLNYHLPYPIETVQLPKALRVSTISIGMTLIDDPTQRGRTMRDVPEASLMLTGDESIVDGDVTALCRLKPTRVGQYPSNLQHAEGYKQQAIAEAKGQSARFLKVYDEYKKAQDVTRERIYLETMERILGGSEKLIFNGGASGQGVVPYLPLNELTPRRPPAATTGQQQQPSGATR